MSKEISYDWNLGTIVKLILTAGRLYLGGWMIISGSSYWLTQMGLPTIFPQPVGNTPLSSQMLVTMIEGRGSRSEERESDSEFSRSSLLAPRS